MDKKWLITVSGYIPDDLRMSISHNQQPQTDYLALATYLDADLLDFNMAWQASTSVEKCIATLFGRTVLLAMVCSRLSKQYEHILADGEQVGLPMALLRFLPTRRRAKIHMIAHVLSVFKKTVLMDVLQLHRQIHTILTYCSAQQQYIGGRWPSATHKTFRINFMVDHHFFSANQVDQTQKPMICAVGWERRDYHTLLQAISDIDIELVIAAGSGWAKKNRSSLTSTLPDNVTVTHCNHVQLRQLYANSLFVVVPLVDVDFQAGITTILEAMSMRRAVICSKTTGQTDVVEDGANGAYVIPEDAEDLRVSILALLADADSARRYGEQGRKWVETHATLSRYCQTITAIVQRDTIN